VVIKLGRFFRKSSKKDVLLTEAIQVMQRPNVDSWYKQTLEGKRQEETINDLVRAIEVGTLTPREALFIAFLVGYQWEVKFKGVS
jgi:hypothetical protein